ncbi:MAG: hypothetical protein AABN95_22630 [Acidobacteriota bacterium]
MPSLSDEIYPGTCILLPKPGGDIKHLWIVLTEAEGDPPQVVIVNLTTRKQGTIDTTCVLMPGDHEFVKSETTVHYMDARLAPAQPLSQIAKLADYDFHADCSRGLLRRIQQGLLDSPFTPKKIKAYCGPRFAFESGAQASAAPPPA